MYVYLLNDSEVNALCAENRNGAQFVPCDYGRGICISEDVLDLPYMTNHKQALEAIKPLAKRRRTIIQMEDV